MIKTKISGKAVGEKIKEVAEDCFSEAIHFEEE